MIFRGMFCVGLIGEKQISAFSICFQVEGFAWMVILLSCVILFYYVWFLSLYTALLAVFWNSLVHCIVVVNRDISVIQRVVVSIAVLM